MEVFDYSSPSYISPSLDEERDKTLYQEIREAMQLLGVDANSRDAECYEALQVHLILCSEAASSPSSSSSSSCSIGSMTSSPATSTLSPPSSSSTQSISPLRPLPLSAFSESSSSFTSSVALNSPTSSTSPRLPNSSCCDLCMEKNVRGLFEEAYPCGHLFCQSCLLFLENESSSPIEDISCILDGCKGHLAPVKAKMKSTKVLVRCTFCKSLQLPKRELLEDNMILSSPNTTDCCYSVRCQCCYCLKLF